VNELHVINPDDDEQAAQIAEDAQWMRVALELAAEAAALGEVPVGAVAVKDGRIVGRGFNRKESDQDPTAHAEMIVLKETAVAVQNWRLLGVTLYCTLEPCPMCAGAMIQARLPRLVYGAKDVRFGAHGSIVNVLDETQFNHRVSITSGVLADEAAELLQQFFQMLRTRKQ
jgi:tRNA(adenine34) deaminase